MYVIDLRVASELYNTNYCEMHGAGELKFETFFEAVDFFVESIDDEYTNPQNEVNFKQILRAV